MTEDEDADPVGEPQSLAIFTRLAVQASLIAHEETLTPEMLAYATLIVDTCAAIGDAYSDDEIGTSAGDAIRSRLYD